MEVKATLLLYHLYLLKGSVAKLNKSAEAIGLKNIGTHSLRKTFDYHYYQRTHDISLLMELFNHSSQSVTLRYIGIHQDVLNETFSSNFKGL